MKCSDCGGKIPAGAKYCSYCGAEIKSVFEEKSMDAPSAGFALLSYLIPPAGFVFFLVWKKKYPLKAKYSGIGALIGLIAMALLLVPSMYRLWKLFF
ncbi:MAG: zinc ribbon domain-containing protein [Bacilli bacterium]|jgi:hypothetical protein|nr:zinc ribbon domain-containing protein [Acholeplasmataceae bacterium]